MTSEGASWNEALTNYDLVRGTTSSMLGSSHSSANAHCQNYPWAACIDDARSKDAVSPLESRLAASSDRASSLQAAQG